MDEELLARVEDLEAIVEGLLDTQDDFDEWLGRRWSARKWAGRRWSGRRWSGRRWSGRRWSLDEEDD